jgi:putative folate metabolism gamma-glutamate ligase
MNIQAIKTHKIVANENLFEILDKYLPKLEEETVLVIASKIVGICEGRIVKRDPTKDHYEQKDELVKQEAEYYLPRKDNQYNFMITVNHNLLVASAGIDESNTEGHFGLWPKDPQKSVNAIREYLCNKHNIKNLGVIMTDSKLSPLRYGVTSYSLAHSGFKALNSYIGKPDVFGRIMKVEKLNMADSLAAAAVIVMGEGGEQQPLAIATEIPAIEFEQKNPTEEELNELKISLEEDIYSTMLTAVKWEKGKKK